mgnify:FL=1
MLALALLGCSQNPAPVASTRPEVSAQQFSDLESRIKTLEQMIRTLDERDGRIVDIANASSSNSGGSAQTPLARPVADGRTREQIQTIDEDLQQMSQRITALTEQITTLTAGVEGVAAEVEQAQTTLRTHEQVIERILSGN